MRMATAFTGGLTVQICWLGLMVGDHLFHQINSVNSRNASTMIIVPHTLPWYYYYGRPA